MGVPRFFRWLVERYPLIMAPLETSTLPVIDNFYLDMNGMVHRFSRPDDGDIFKTLSEEEIMLRIMNRIDYLFQLVRPRKYFFMGLDGVAPRAKMNQQRQRRFRSAQGNIEAREAAIRKGEHVPPPEELFDSNCITPGTEFMGRLTEYLKYFFSVKINQDPAWQDVHVVFSGHEVPGEGEHKIMEFIRNRKTQPDYDPNEVHCLYGADADLIMLALVSHTPHVVILREEIKFGPGGTFSTGTGGKPQHTVREQKWQLMYVNLLREYLDMEFSSLKEGGSATPHRASTAEGGSAWRAVPFGYSLERVIDDFIVLGYLMGNDFLPRLPTFDIGEGAFNTMFELYKSHLPTLGGYLTEDGAINFDRLEAFLRHVAALEKQVLDERLRDRREFEKRSRRQERREDKKNTDTFGEAAMGLTKSLPLDLGSLGASGLVSDGPLEDEEDAGGDEERVTDVLMSSTAADGKTIDLDKFRALYYRDKLRFDEPLGGWTAQSAASSPQVRELVKSYLSGLVWIFEYYVSGVPSWKWFFPFHYAPLASDLLNLADISREIAFDRGLPFRPFQQLLGVLPAASCRLLPAPFRPLMTSRESPIIGNYPSEFEVDREGTRAEWEGIALIPFIDEQRLVEACGLVQDSSLTTKEHKRNSFGRTVVMVNADSPLFAHMLKHPCGRAALAGVDEHETTIVPPSNPRSPLAGSFVSLSSSKLKYFYLDQLLGPQHGLKFDPVLAPGTLVGKRGLQHFPTFQTLSHSSDLKKIGCTVLGQASRKETRVIELHLPEASESTESIATALLGQHVFAGYPYSTEGVVSAVVDASGTYRQEPRFKPHSPQDAEMFAKLSATHETTSLNQRGLILGKVSIVVFVQPLERMQQDSSGGIKKRFQAAETAFPLQAILFDYDPQPDPRFLEKSALALAQRFRPGAPCVMLNEKYHGCQGQIVKVDASSHSLTVSLRISTFDPTRQSIPGVGSCLADQNSETEHYAPTYEVARMLGISHQLLSKITSSIQIGSDKKEIGLCFKFGGKAMRVVGYARRVVQIRKNAPAATASSTAGFNGNGGFDPLAPVGVFTVTGGMKMVPDETGPVPAAPGTSVVWELSPRAIAILREYKSRYPSLFVALDALSRAGKDDRTDARTLFPSAADPNAAVDEVVEWLKKQPHSTLPLVPCATDSISLDSIRSLESVLRLCSPVEARTKEVKLAGVAPSLVCQCGDIPPYADNTKDHFALLDRVVCLKGSGPVPFGTRGTIVALYSTSADVVFDQELLGAGDLLGRLTSMRGLNVALDQLLNLSRPRPRRPTAMETRLISGAAQRQQQQQPQSDSQQQTSPEPFKSVPSTSSLLISDEPVAAHVPPVQFISPLPVPQTQSLPDQGLTDSVRSFFQSVTSPLAEPMLPTTAAAGVPPSVIPFHHHPPPVTANPFDSLTRPQWSTNPTLQSIFNVADIMAGLGGSSQLSPTSGGVSVQALETSIASQQQLINSIDSIALASIDSSNGSDELAKMILAAVNGGALPPPQPELAPLAPSSADTMPSPPKLIPFNLSKHEELDGWSPAQDFLEIYNKFKSQRLQRERKALDERGKAGQTPNVPPTSSSLANSPQPPPPATPPKPKVVKQRSRDDVDLEKEKKLQQQQATVNTLRVLPRPKAPSTQLLKSPEKPKKSSDSEKPKMTLQIPKKGVQMQPTDDVWDMPVQSVTRAKDPLNWQQQSSFM